MANRRMRKGVTREQALLRIAKATLHKWLRDYAADPANTEEPTGPWFELMCRGLGYDPDAVVSELHKRMGRA
jgi:hypothetical protein